MGALVLLGGSREGLMSSSARPLIVLAGSEYPGGTSRGAADHAPGSGQTARERGLEVLVLDQARGDVGLPVVKVIIPGLRHFWRPRVRGRPSPADRSRSHPSCSRCSFVFTAT